MTAISAGLVKELREQTGAGMMACKRALEETGGDIEAARRLLREKGMAAAGKRAGLATTEGRVLARVADDASRGTMVAVGCETDFVSENDEFLAYAEKVLDAVDANGPGGEEALEQERVELVGRIGENVAVVGVARFEAVEGSLVEAYVHPPAQKVGALVNVRGGDAEVARKLAMHISWAEPRWVAREDVPPDLVEVERGIYLASDEVQSKPEQARERIVEGMTNKRFFAERGGVLVDQAWIHDQSKTVARALAEHRAEVLEFARLALTG